jgi:hypothetical protein
MKHKVIRLATSALVAIVMAGIVVDAMPQAFAQVSQAIAP